MNKATPRSSPGTFRLSEHMAMQSNVFLLLCFKTKQKVAWNDMKEIKKMNLISYKSAMMAGFFIMVCAAIYVCATDYDKQVTQNKDALTQRDQLGIRPMMMDNIERRLRYSPDNGDFVITNGSESFNRSLYGGSSSFRVDAGDMPEYSLYLPGRGGNLRLGIRSAAGTKWLNQAAHIVARYRSGSMIHEIRDPLLGSGLLRITAIAPHTDEGLIIQAESQDINEPVELVLAFGGINGDRGSRDGDIGTERMPVREYFRLRPNYCQSNKVTLNNHTFMNSGKGGIIHGVLPEGAILGLGNANFWDQPSVLFSEPADKTPELPIVIGHLPLVSGRLIYLALQHIPSTQSGSEVLATYREVAAEYELESDTAGKNSIWVSSNLPEIFKNAEAYRQSVAGRVTVHTPDPYLDAAVTALNTAADGVWDDRRSAYLHGGVAWRVRLLGWRVGYTGDALGWHERTRAHFDGYAAQQNTNPIPDAIAAPESSANLSRNETALHSNGDMTKSHYDMNLVGIDVFFRHLLWTGDLEYARRMWPVIKRHLAWERRLFRREFGPEKLPLYETYCCIWASDSVSYNGGGAAYSTAYNLYHNRMAARVAKLIGADPSPYEREAALIDRAMHKYLWLPERGWFAEWKDLLGLQLVHPNAAAWTFYHTIDSRVPSPFEAWQMTRFADTQLPHIPIRGEGVPQGNYTISTTTWMPYMWSINNVVLAESVHTALALWQAGRIDAAYPLFKGTLLDSMYLGICPGNVGMCTWFDVNRRESQRDFGDGIGTLARTVVEGVFGVTPDLLSGEVCLRPGFPIDWNHAKIHHPDFDFAFTRDGQTERYKFVSRFSSQVRLRLQVRALCDGIDTVTVNGRPADWRVLEDSVGIPQIEIEAAPATQHDLVIVWQGISPAVEPAEIAVMQGSIFKANAGAKIIECEDPQSVLHDASFTGTTLTGTVNGIVGHRTVFVRVTQGQLRWWQPLMLDVHEANPSPAKIFTTDWHKPLESTVTFEPVPMSSIFNDRVSQIFRHEYLTPRSPFCSLAQPKQGYGSWCSPTAAFIVNDSGLRATAAKNDDCIALPNGVPLMTPGQADVPNIAFVSQWDNFPRELTIPLSGYASKIYLLMAGSTWGMQSRFDNGEIIITYTDGSTARFALENPTIWWPIDQDYFIEDFGFACPGSLPLRIDLRTGKIRVLDRASFIGKGRRVDGGAATVLDLTLDPNKTLKSITVRALANEVVIGLMSATLQRP